jgi:hypothetical protein
MSNFIPVENRLGIQPISSTNGPTPSQFQVGQSQAFGQAHPLGTIVRAEDATLGEGEFIYLEGAANTVVGSVVTYNNLAGTTTLAATTAGKGAPLAVSMSANLAGQFGWYQISGLSVMATNGTLALTTTGVFVSTTAGEATSTVAAGAEIENAIAVAAVGTPSTGLAIVSINRPFFEGQIT